MLNRLNFGGLLLRRTPSFLGVDDGQTAPVRDWEILVPPGAVLGARLRAFVGRNFILGQIALVLIGYAAINDYLHLAPPPTRVAANTNIAWPSPLHRVSVKFSPYLFPALPAEVPHELAQLDVMAAPSAGLTTQQGAAIMAAAVNWIANTNQRDVLDSTKANFPPGVSAVPFAQFPSKLSDQSAMAGGLIGFSTSMVVFQQEFLERGSFGPIFFAASINGQPALYAFTVKANFYGNMLTECVTIAGPQVGFCGPSSQEEIDRSFSAGGRGVTLLSILSREP